jgi:hypothetical protein
MSSSMNPPDPYGTDDQSGSSSGGSGQPEGSAPSPYGSTPPTYGSTPPAYGSQPPAYGSQPGYGSQPPAYGSDPAYGGGYGSPYGQPAFAYPKNSLGIWSLVLGLLGLVLSCGLFTGIPAIIVGNRAKTAVAQGQANNPGMATAGIVLGWIATILSVIGIVLFVVLIATGTFTEFATNGTSSETF